VRAYWPSALRACRELVGYKIGLPDEEHVQLYPIGLDIGKEGPSGENDVIFKPLKNR
jgi:hypothetical protein